MLIVPWTAAGGADKFNLDLISQLKRRHWETTVVTTLPGDHSWLPQFERAATETFPLPHLSEPHEYPRFLGNLIDSRQPDAILISHSEFAYAALPFIRRVAGQTPIVDYCHVVEEYWRHGGYPDFSLENQHLLDLSVTASQQIKDWMVRRGAEPDRIEVCHINIDPGLEAQGSRASHGLPDDVPLILYPCRLVFQKQPHVFAKTMLELDRRGYRFLAVAVGEGPYRAWLQSFVARHSLQHCVRLFGYRPHTVVQELLSVADCVFLPSSSEGIALVLYEAMAAGLPVVAADVGGQRELVTQDCGVLVQRADETSEVQRYTEVLAGLLDNPDRRKALGNAGRARISTHFTLDMMGTRMDALLEHASEFALAHPRAIPAPQDADRSAIEAAEMVRRVSRVVSQAETARTGVADTETPMVIDLVLPSLGPTDGPRRFLEALEAQTYPHFRLIVVDQNSDDRLYDVFVGEQPFPILHLHAGPGRSHARNVGLAHCDADVVSFPRDDCWFPPDLLEQVVALLDRHPRWEAVIGRCVDPTMSQPTESPPQEGGRLTRFNVWRRVDGPAAFLRGRAVKGKVWFDETLNLTPHDAWLEDLDVVLQTMTRGGFVYQAPSLQVFGEARPAVQSADDAYWGGVSIGRVLRKFVPRWILAYQVGLALAAAAIERARGRSGPRRLQLAAARGRLRGWLMAGSKSSSPSSGVRPVIDAASPDFASTPVAETRPSFEYRGAAHGTEPCLTIMTPFFDTDPAVFEETVASVQGQSLQQWEWVIVDDGSSRPDSLELLGACADADPRIRIVRHEWNRGVVAARNTGLASAGSDFVLQLDSDDLLEPTAAEKWLWFLVSHPEYAFVNSFQVGFGEEQYLWPRGFEEREVFLTENLTNPGGVARLNLFAAIGNFDESLTDGLEDWEFWLRCASFGYWGATVPEFLKWHRRKGGDSERWPNWDGGMRQQQLLATWRERYPQLWRGGFPQIEPRDVGEVEAELRQLPFENPLAKSKQRLLLVVPWATMGGSDKFNVDLVEQLRRRDWETTVVTTLYGDHARLPQLAALTPDIFALSHFLKPADFARFFKYLIRSRSPDVILISHSRFGYTALPYLRRVAGGIPIVDYSHVVEPGWLDGGYPRLSVDAGDLIDLRITSSHDLRDWMLDQGATPDSVAVCYTNVDPAQQFARELESFDFPRDRALILYPCRICAQKQPAVFAKSLRELRRRGQDFLAVVAGDGPDLPWLQAYVRRSGLADYVRFLGRQPNDVTAALMQRADVVFLPSKYEGIALTLFEALAAGTPVVAADVGGQRELVTPDCGVLLAPSGDEDDEAVRYADALSELLADPERRERMGQAARTRIMSSFTLEQMGEQMDSLVGHARELACENPPASPSMAEARAAACVAIRITRWQQLPSRPHGRPPLRVGAHLRVRLLSSIAAVGRPIYRLSKRRGYRWLDPLKNWIVRLLLRHD